ncbi:MAG: ArnT family glycosyltransferase, partial [bacterium]
MDELTHARAAQGAVLHGHWWPLVLDHKPFYEKPPLMLWLGAATAEISHRPYATWPYRLWPCLGAGLALSCLVLIGALLDRPGAGLIAAAGLALQGDFIYHARFFTFDTLFVACMLGALALSLRAVERGQPKDWLWAGVALALAAAFKSWFVLSLVPAYACALSVHLPRARRKSVLWVLCWPSLLVMLSWIAVYVQWNGWGFLSEEWSNNLVGRIRGQNFPLDPDGHAAFYLKWVVRAAPAILPWALAAPLLLFKDGTGPERKGGRSHAFARTWTGVFCLSWLVGLACVRAETLNYVLPLEAGLCLAAGLCFVDRRVGVGRVWIRVALVLASVLAALRIWDPIWSLASGLVFGLAWRIAGPARWVQPGTRQKAKVLALILGLTLAVLLGREAWGLLTKPLDPNRGLAELLLAHPAKRPGESLWFVAKPTQAPYFYSSYRIRQVDVLPAKRPPEACLVKLKKAWVFFPA